MICVTYEAITGWLAIAVIVAVVWGVYWIAKEDPSYGLTRSEHDRNKFVERKRVIGYRLNAKPKTEARYFEGILGGDGGQALQPGTENNQREP